MEPGRSWAANGYAWAAFMCSTASGLRPGPACVRAPVVATDDVTDEHTRRGTVESELVPSLPRVSGDVRFVVSCNV
jgi:hypothetical protein